MKVSYYKNNTLFYGRKRIVMLYEKINTFPNINLKMSDDLKISLGFYIHHESSKRDEDQIIFKHLIKHIRTDLEMFDESDEKDILIQKIQDIELDMSLFNHTDQSILLYIDQHHTSMYTFHTEIDSFHQVSQYFHIKPLIQYYQSLKNYHILALDANQYRILEGNQYGVQLLTDVENESLETMFEDQEHQNYVTRGTYGGADAKGAFHGHGSTKDQKDIMKMKYFHEVDLSVMQFQEKNQALPLILLTSAIHSHDFKSISKNHHLVNDVIEVSFHDLTIEEISNHIKKIDDAQFETVLHSKVKSYHDRLDSKLSSHDIVEIKQALLEGKVETLIIKNANTLTIEDELMNLGIENGSEIMIVDNEIQEDQELMAIFRYR